MAPRKPPVLVCEAETFGRMAQLLFDPKEDAAAMTAALADFFAHDVPDFKGWCERVRRSLPQLDPSDVRLIKTDAEFDANLPEATALLIESFEITRERLAAAPNLKVVLKNGVLLRNVDVAACEERGVKVLTVRRRANMGVAETALTLMLMLSKRTWDTENKVTFGTLQEAGRSYRAFDRRYASNANFARVPGLRSLHGTTLGIIGLGEIGREIAQRANGFGMTVLYNQRTTLTPQEERHHNVRFAAVPDLLSASDWVIPQLPMTPLTRAIFSRTWFEQMKPGAFLVVVSRAELIERAALLDALRSKRLAGLGLDPLYDEPMRDDDELLSFNNVILLPHIASQPRTNVLGDAEEIVTKVAHALTD